MQLRGQLSLRPFMGFSADEPEPRVAGVGHAPLRELGGIARSVPPHDLGAPTFFAAADPALQHLRPA